MKLSVIVPIYNTERYLSRCIESLLCIDVSDYEIILVDDGSTDSSGEICDEYAEKYSTVRSFHKKNGGIISARVFGVANSCGKYIAFVDSDDWVKADMFVKLMREAIAHPETEMVKCGYCETKGDNQEKAILFSGDRYQQISEKENLCRYYSKGAPWVVAWNTVYRQDLAKKVKFPAGLYHEDNYASFFYLYFSRKCIVVNEPLYCYWQNPESIMRDKVKIGKRNRDKLEVRKRLLDYVSGQNQSKSSLMYKKIAKLWAKAYFHLIRDDKSIRNISQRELATVCRNLDWRRKIQLRYFVIRRRIKIDSDV